MSYWEKANTAYYDSASIDAFIRLRTSEVVTLIDSQQNYGDSALVWENLVTGTGNVTNNLNGSMVNLNTGGTASGAQVLRQTKTYQRYQPGKSLMVFETFVFAPPQTNLRQRIGYFDTNNGIYLEQAGSTINIVRRSFVSGSVVNTAIPQASWNLDTLNGSGPSGVTLDLTKAQILIIDLQWLGVGRVRIGFNMNGFVYYAHQFEHANLISTTYMTTACLPCRAEITNTGTATSAATLGQICCTVGSEAGISDELGLQFSTDNGTTGSAVGGTLIPLLSIRAGTTGPNSVRNTGQILVRNYTVLNTSGGNVLYRLVLNPTSLTGASWSAVNSTYSLAQVDMSSTALSGGVVLDSGYTSGTAKNTQTADLVRKQALVYSGLNSIQDTLVLAAQTIGGGTNTLYASMTWQELY